MACARVASCDARLEAGLQCCFDRWLSVCLVTSISPCSARELRIRSEEFLCRSPFVVCRSHCVLRTQGFSLCFSDLVHDSHSQFKAIAICHLPSFYLLLKFLFHLFLIPAMVPDDDSMNDPLCNSAIGSMVTFDFVTPDTDLVLDNGHLLDQVVKRNAILPRIAHKEPGIISRKKCCWNSRKADILLPVQRLHCPGVSSRARDMKNCRYISLQIIEQLKLFRIILSVNQLSIYGAVAAICEEFEDHQD